MTPKKQMGVWPKVHDRLINLWEELALNERRHFPEKVRKWIEDNDVFANYK